jgi:hypothetical protein
MFITKIQAELQSEELCDGVPMLCWTFLIGTVATHRHSTSRSNKADLPMRFQGRLVYGHPCQRAIF